MRHLSLGVEEDFKLLSERSFRPYVHYNSNMTIVALNLHHKTNCMAELQFFMMHLGT